MAKVLGGKNLAEQIESDLKTQVASMDCIPTLVTCLVGDNPPSKMYIKMKAKACERIGIICHQAYFPTDTPQEVIEYRIRAYNCNPLVHGILLQHPVPAHYDERALFDAISVEKDVDGVSAESFIRLTYKRPGFKPATPYGIMKLLKHYKIRVKGNLVVVVGVGPILGKPLALMFENDGATVVLCNIHTHERVLRNVVREANIVVGACGVPGRIKAEWIDYTQILIDAGYKGGKGDIEPEAWENSYAYTPVPNGVGPLTISTLLSQTVDAARKLTHS